MLLAEHAKMKEAREKREAEKKEKEEKRLAELRWAGLFSCHLFTRAALSWETRCSAGVMRTDSAHGGTYTCWAPCIGCVASTACFLKAHTLHSRLQCSRCIFSQSGLALIVTVEVAYCCVLIGTPAEHCARPRPRRLALHKIS
jgi:hypothetical protein